MAIRSNFSDNMKLLHETSAEVRSVFSFCFTKYLGITVYLQFKHSSDFQATEFFTNSCLNYPKNVQMWSVKWVLASKQKLLVHWAKNRWTCLYAFLALSHCVCKTDPWIIILTVEMEYINHSYSFLSAASLSPWPTLPLLLSFMEQLTEQHEFLCENSWTANVADFSA